MTTTLPKVPLPLPKSGVVVAAHPREVGLDGLAFSRNFINKDGIFQSRDGLRQYGTQPLAPASGETALGCYQCDLQDEGTVYKDALFIGTTHQLHRYSTESDTWLGLTEQTPEWCTEVVGPDSEGEDAWVVASKITMDISRGVAWASLGNGGSNNWVTVTITITNGASYDFTVEDSDGVDYTTGTQTGALPESVPATITVYDDAATPVDLGIDITFNDNDFAAEVENYGTILTYYAKIKKANGATLIDPSAGQNRDDLWVFRAWDYNQQTHVLAANPNMFILDHNNASSVVTIAGNQGITPQAKTIGVAGQRIVACNIELFDSAENIKWNPNPGYFHGADGNDPYTIKWPDGYMFSDTVLTGGHTVWRSTSIGRLADSPGSIVACLEMGTMMLVVYKTDAIYVLVVQTGTSPFRPDLRAQRIEGPVGPQAVTAISENLHAYLGRDGALYMFDGSPPRTMGPHLQRWITAEMDNDYAHRAHLTYDKENNWLKVMYPTKGSAGAVRKGLIVNVGAGEPFPGWPVEYDDTATQTWDLSCAYSAYLDMEVALGDIHAMMGDVDGIIETLKTRDHDKILINATDAVVYEEDPLSDDDGVPINTKIRSGLSDLGMPERFKSVTEIELFSDGIEGGVTGSLTLLGGDLDTRYRQLAQVSIDMSSFPLAAQFRTDPSRYFGLDFEVSTAEKFTIGGGLISVKPRGLVR